MKNSIVFHFRGHGKKTPISIFHLHQKNTYPTDKTLPVSFKLASSETPLILSSKIEETSVGAALAEANL
jgi:hypothetical protein